MNSEEKILELLGKLSDRVDQQGELLGKLSDRADRQGELLGKLSDRADRQGELLEKLSDRVDRQGELLEKLADRVGRQGELLEELDDRSLRSAVMLENEVLPKLQLLYEGHVHLQETLAPRERVEVLEDEVITLKSAMKLMMKRLDALERAQ